MNTKLIKLTDNTLIEVAVSNNQPEEISGRFAEKVDSTIDSLKPILILVCSSIHGAWEELNKEMHIEQAEIELGLGFEAEGNIYVTKAKTNANISVKLTLKPPGN